MHACSCPKHCYIIHFLQTPMLFIWHHLLGNRRHKHILSCIVVRYIRKFSWQDSYSTVHNIIFWNSLSQISPECSSPSRKDCWSGFMGGVSTKLKVPVKCLQELSVKIDQTSMHHIFFLQRICAIRIYNTLQRRHHLAMATANSKVYPRRKCSMK